MSFAKIRSGISFVLSLITVLLITSGRSSNAQSVTGATVSGKIFAEVITVFSASETSQLYFGKFSPGPQGGEIILTPYNTVMVTGSVYTGPGIHNAASFYVTGDVDALYTITLPSMPSTLTNTTNAKTMLVTNWSSVPGPGLGMGKLENGFQTVFVGATLKVGSLYDNPPGIYTGTYSITFDFN